jgi:hypothetical protein
VIIRRPHAYDFLMQAYADQVEDPEQARGSEAGIEVGDLVLPLPGFYVLDPGGKVIGKCGLGSVEEVVAFLGDVARP